MAVARRTEHTGPRRTARRKQRPPGPSFWRVVTNNFWERDLLALLTRLTERYGDVVRLRVPGKTFFVLQAPEDIEHVLVANHDNYRKSFDYRLLAVVTGKGLLT